MHQQGPDLVAKPRLTRERGLSFAVVLDHDEWIIVADGVSAEDAYRAQGLHHEGSIYPGSQPTNPPDGWDATDHVPLIRRASLVAQ
jgi:hypothetical protein